MRLCARTEDAEDLVQETWLRASNSLPDPLPRHERGWLFSILRNLVIDRGRRRRARPEEPLDSEVPAPAPEPLAAWRTVSTAQLKVAMETLPLPLRNTYEMFLDGASYRSIARTLHISENTVASRLYRARQRLRDQLVTGGEA